MKNLDLNKINISKQSYPMKSLTCVYCKKRLYTLNYKQGSRTICTECHKINVSKRNFINSHCKRSLNSYHYLFYKNEL